MRRCLVLLAALAALAAAAAIPTATHHGQSTALGVLKGPGGPPDPGPIG